MDRVFNEGCLLAENEGRNFIRESNYVVLTGGKSPFLDKLDKLEKVIEPLGERDGLDSRWSHKDMEYHLTASVPLSTANGGGRFSGDRSAVPRQVVAGQPQRSIP